MDEKQFKNLTESALDILKSLASDSWLNQDDSWKMLSESFVSLRDSAGLDKDATLDIVNFGSKSQPNLFILADKVELGTITMNEIGEVDTVVNKEARASIEVDKEVKENLKDFAKEVGDKDLEKSADKVVDSMTHPENPKMDPMQAVFDDINDSIIAAGGDPKDSIRMQQKAMRDAGIKMPSRHDIKHQIKANEKEINSIYNALNREMAIAKINGLDPKNIEAINEKSEQIKKLTFKNLKLRAEMPTRRQTVLNGFENAKAAINKTFDRVGVAIDKKIEAGKEALTRIKDTVKDANEKFAAQRDTAYTGLTEKVEQINRDYLSVCYSVDRSMAKNIDKLKEHLEKSYDRKAEIRGAFRDLGRAITGKERHADKPEFTKSQKNVLSMLEGMSKACKDEMKELKIEYDISRDLSKINLRGAQDYRESTGLKRSNWLDEKIKDVSSKNIGEKKVSAPVKEDKGFDR